MLEDTYSPHKSALLAQGFLSLEEKGGLQLEK
jgi:hypothetical protein